MSYFFSRIFHFVTRDYFRYRDESSEESESEEEEQHGDFVAGGIYSPQVHVVNIEQPQNLQRLVASTLK